MSEIGHLYLTHTSLLTSLRIGHIENGSGKPKEKMQFLILDIKNGHK